MQSAKSIVDQALSRPSTESSKPSLPEKLRQGLLDNLWLKMTEMYGHRWTGSVGVSADQSHAWAAVLGGLNGQQIAVGLAALAANGDDWPPSAPEFRKLCVNRTPEAFGLPSVDQAYREATRNVHPNMVGIGGWSHSAVHHAACEAGFYNLITLPMDTSRKLFERNYTIACRMVMDGEPLKPIPLALPESVDGRRTEEVGRRALAKLRGQLLGDAAHG